jgi:RND family efflux transporter MFP subunit
MSEESGVSGSRALPVLLRFLVGVLVLAAGFGVLGLLVRTRPEPVQHARADRAVTVRVMTATPVEVPRVWEGYGTARAMVAAEVAAQVAARVVERPRRIEPGVAVARGDVLLRLDPTDFEQRVASLRQTIGSWEAQLLALAVEERRLADQVELAQEEVTLEERELERAIAAAGQGAGTETEIERRRASVVRKRREIVSLSQRLEGIPAERLRLESLLGSERANLRVAEENLARATIVAPIDGVLQRVDVREGEMVAVGQAVARIVDLRRVEVPLRLAISALAGVGVGDPVELRTDTAAAESPAPAWTGRIARVAPEADPATRTVTAFVEVEQDAGAAGRGLILLPGQFVVGEVRTVSPEARIVLPQRALDGDRVLIAEPSGEVFRVRSVEVRVAQFLRQRIRVLDPVETQWAVLESGLEPGARVILTSLDELGDGALVSIEPAEAAATARDGGGP